MSVTGGGLDPIVAELRSIRAAQSKLPRAVWATVAQQVPLRIIVDGDTQPMAGRPAQTSPAPSAGTRVLCLMQNGRATVIGNAPDPELPEGTTVEQIIKGTLGTTAQAGSLAYLRSGILDPSQRTVVVVAGSSTFRAGSARIGATERLAYLAGSPDFPILEDQTARPTSGMRWFQGAVGGTGSNGYLNETRLQKIDLVEPDYVIHGMGSNDYAVQRSIADYKANMRSVMNRIEADTPGVVNVLVHQQGRSDNPSRPISWAEYGEALREVAEENTSRVFIDADALMDTYMLHDPSNPFGIQSADKIHLNNKGYKILAQVLGDSLGIPRTPFVPDELHDISLVDSATYSPGTPSVLGSQPLPATRYPRTLTVTYAGFARTSTGEGHIRMDVGVGGSYNYRLVADGVNHAITISRIFYIPPGTAPTIAVECRPGTGSVYVSGASGFAYLTATEQSY